MKDRFPSLPPGTIPSDIDDHYGELDEGQALYHTDVNVGVSLGLPRKASDQEVIDHVIDYLQSNPPDDVINVEIMEQEPIP